MFRVRRAVWIPLACGLVLTACGSGDDQAATVNTTKAPAPSTTVASESEFCTIMSAASALLEPDPPDAKPAPEETKDKFDEIASLLARAEEAAPAALAADIATFATAIDKYRVALADAGYNLGVIYSTPEGIALANDTSHALSEPVVNHMIGPCGIKPNGGEQRDP